MQKYLLALFILFISFVGPGVYATPVDSLVTVRLFDAHRPLQCLTVLPPFRLILPDQNLTVSIPATIYVDRGKICLSNQNRIIIASPHKLALKAYGDNTLQLITPTTKQPRRYHGSLVFSIDSDRSLDVTNKVSAFNYIEDVVASEAPLHAPLEMLKAQAILAQTVLFNAKDSDVISDSTQNQCYIGANLENQQIAVAVRLVFGEKLCYQGSPIIAYYHSTCAGGTSNGTEFFNLPADKLPYLKAVPCKDCHDSPFWKTTRTQIAHDPFAKIFGNGLPEIIKEDQNHRPLSIKLANGKTLSGYDFWIQLGNNFGWDKAPGTRFKISLDNKGDYIIESTGAGHGVGCCQWGACGLSKQGKSYRQILKYYFPDCEIQ